MIDSWGRDLPLFTGRNRERKAPQTQWLKLLVLLLPASTYLSLTLLSGLDEEVDPEVPGKMR